MKRTVVAGIESIFSVPHRGLVLSTLSPLDENYQSDKKGDDTHDRQGDCSCFSSLAYDGLVFMMSLPTDP
jgi:hypothetical protein